MRAAPGVRSVFTRSWSFLYAWPPFLHQKIYVLMILPHYGPHEEPAAERAMLGGRSRETRHVAYSQLRME